jgi:hypothetical protein
VMSDHDKHAATSALARLIVDAKLSFKLVESLRFENLPDLSTSFFQLSAGAH